MAWAFTIWALAVGTLFLPVQLTSPHYKYLLTLPGGQTLLGLTFSILGIAAIGTLLAGMDGFFRGIIGMLGVLSVMVASMLLVASFTLPNGVNMGPLTWGMVGVLAVMYALPVDREDS